MKCGGSFLSSVIIFSVVMTTICHVVALVTSYWLRSSTTTQRGFLNLGLWKACFDNFVHPHENPSNYYFGCHGLYSDYLQNLSEWLVPPWLSVCQTLSTISLITLLIGLVMSILLLSWTAIHWLTRYPKRNVLLLQNCLLCATPIVHAITGVFMLLTASIFADNAPRLQCKEFWLGGEDPFANSLSFSWTFELLASMLSFLSAGLFVWFAVLKGRDDI